MQLDPTQLLLIPGLQGVSLTAAAAGDQQALAYLGRRIEEHASLSDIQELLPQEAFRLAAYHAAPLGSAMQLDPDYGQKLAHTFSARQESTEQMFLLAARGGKLAALKWLRALCHPVCEPGLQMMQAAGQAANLRS